MHKRLAVSVVLGVGLELAEELSANLCLTCILLAGNKLFD